MRRSRRPFRRMRFKGREYVWMTISGAAPLTQGGTTFDEFVLVSRNDWARDPANTATIEKGATLVRVVGDVWFKAMPEDHSVASVRGITDVECYFGLLKRDEDDLSALDISIDAFGEDWMHLHAEHLAVIYSPVATLTAGWGANVAGRHVDVRVKRKLTTEDVVKACFLPVRANLGTDVGVSFLLRALVQLP